ncbi:MAG: DUF485 domain-containing protein [Gammaproteobacteria bacterium]|nr:DUF485 domain-containing protein [Gammaproteobacteria bacterium]
MRQYYRRIHDDQRFHELERKRGRFSWALALIVLVVYYSFILIVAFSPQAFAKTISADSVISLGIPVGLLVIIVSFLSTGIYVFRANREFDSISKEIVEKHVGDGRD